MDNYLVELIVLGGYYLVRENNNYYCLCLNYSFMRKSSKNEFLQYCFKNDVVEVIITLSEKERLLIDSCNKDVTDIKNIADICNIHYREGKNYIDFLKNLNSFEVKYESEYDFYNRSYCEENTIYITSFIQKYFEYDFCMIAIEIGKSFYQTTRDLVKKEVLNKYKLEDCFS